MNDRRPIDADIRGTGEEDGRAGNPGRGTEPSEKGVSEERFKEALSYHAAGVTLVALRLDGEIHATTVSSFMPVSASPPTVVVSVGGNARVLPFLEEGREFVVNLLSPGQRRLATVFADSFPVGPSPFPDRGPPEVVGALVALRCRVDSTMETPGAILVVGRVEDVRLGEGEAALVHYRRGYHSVGGDQG